MIDQLFDQLILMHDTKFFNHYKILLYKKKQKRYPHLILYKVIYKGKPLPSDHRFG